ncbi:MAG: hypothetical protein H7X79_02545 [Sporomusaceae bacterium]|nr:hypothetical protein [Sporomusaceae bacterium]
MEIEKIPGVEQVIYQSEDGEQKIYVLPNQETVDQVLAKLLEGGVSDTLELSLSPQGQESKQRDTLLEDMASRLKAITDTPTGACTLGEIEELLGEEYLAVDGEQKIYVLPENVAIEEVLSNFKGLRTGEIKQSQMWRKTESKIYNKEQSDKIEAMDKRIRELESLLDQATGQENKVNDK